MELTGTHLRYLLHMYEMSQREDEMRLTEIAKALHVKKASVARIVSIFREKQLVDQQKPGTWRKAELLRQMRVCLFNPEADQTGRRRVAACTMWRTA